MIPLHDEDREPLQVWKRSLQEEDEQDIEEMSNQEALGAAATMVIICGVILTVIIGACIGGYILFDKYRHLVGL